MDLINRVILPSILIMIFSILLGIEVIKSRSRILGNFEKEGNEFVFNNIRLAFSSMCLNIIYTLSQMPISIFTFLPNYSQIYGFKFSYYIFYFSYSINFYIILISNSLFRKELLIFLKNSIKNLFK